MPAESQHGAITAQAAADRGHIARRCGLGGEHIHASILDAQRLGRFLRIGHGVRQALVVIDPFWRTWILRQAVKVIFARDRYGLGGTAKRHKNAGKDQQFHAHLPEPGKVTQRKLGTAVLVAWHFCGWVTIFWKDRYTDHRIRMAWPGRPTRESKL